MAKIVSEPNPPDPLFIVFCRICGIKGMAAAKLGAAQDRLGKICASCQEDENVYSTHSSVYGRFLCVLTAQAAIEMAKRIMDEAARQGVSVAIGIEQGRVGPVRDVGPENLIGPPINLAARLGAMDEAEGCVFATERAKKAVCAAAEDYCPAFGDGLPGKVKCTEFIYHALAHDRPPLLALEIGGSTERTVHALVYDVARFSEMDPDEAWEVLIRLRKEVVAVLRRTGCLSGPMADHLWYAPAGDGGVLVFSSEFGGDRVLDVAERLASVCRQKGLAVRLGLAHGSAVVLDDALPVGSGILRADALSALPATGHICVDRPFWQDRTATDTNRWQEKQHYKDANAFLIAPEGMALPIPGERLEDLLPSIVDYIRSLPSRHPALHLQVVTGLRAAKVRNVPPGVKDLVEMVGAAGIHEVLAAMRRWLHKPDLPGELDCQGIRGVVAHLLILGIADRTWLAESQAALGSEKLPVPLSTNRLAAGVLVAGILDVAVRLVGGEPENLVPTDSSVGSVSDVPAERFAKLKVYLASKWGSDSDVLEILEADLEASEPWFVLLDAADDGLADLVLDSSQKGGLEGFLLVLQKQKGQTELIKKARGLQRHVEQLFKLLDELDGTSQRRSTL